MRPLELTLSGFRSYRREVTFDFRGRRLVGVVGPIGAGKSSLLDAIAFALYGKTPSVERDTRSLIHQLCDEAHVGLRFEVEGQVWRAVRAPRRKGQSGHTLAHLASDAADAPILETVTGKEAVDARVQQLLGMDFKTFCRSVLLAQNRFSEFLTATDGDRDRVLKGVFGYERLDLAQAAARVSLQLAEGALDTLAERRRGIDEARTQLDAAREAAAAAERTLRSLEAVRPRVDELTAALVGAESTASQARATIAETEQVAASLPPHAELAAVLEAAAGARDLTDAASVAAEAAESERAQRRAELADLSARLGDRTRFESFESLVVAHEQQVGAIAAAAEGLARSSAAIDVQEAAAAGAASDLAGTAAGIEAADRHAADAERAVEEARDALESARHGEMARELRGTLAMGADCPVCGRPVTVLPKGGAARKVKAAETTLRRAEAARKTAQDAARDAAAAHAGAGASLRAAREALAAAHADHARLAEASGSAEAAAAATRSQLAEWLGEEGDPRELFEARASEVRAAEEAAAEASAVWEQARAVLDRARDDAKATEARLGAIAVQLAGVWGRLGQLRDVAPEPEALRAAFVEIGSALVSRHEEARAAGAAADELRLRAEGDRAEVLAGVGLAPEDDLARATAEAAAAHGAAAQQVDDLSSRIAEADELERAVLEAERRRDIAKRLSDDLRPSQFLAYLLEEERAELAELGSEHFEQLSGGDFRFTDDATFGIVDRNAAGTERKAESLSGGETFLASLALAIALAEMVTRGGGRLDAFFLDEGFGSLDPEHLDLAMDGIGRLVAEDVGRLVVLVSHVAEMREAIEDLIVLDKDDLSGDTVVVSGAEPA